MSGLCSAVMLLYGPRLSFSRNSSLGLSQQNAIRPLLLGETADLELPNRVLLFLRSCNGLSYLWNPYLADDNCVAMCFSVDIGRGRW